MNVRRGLRRVGVVYGGCVALVALVLLAFLPWGDLMRCSAPQVITAAPAHWALVDPCADDVLALIDSDDCSKLIDTRTPDQRAAEDKLYHDLGLEKMAASRFRAPPKRRWIPAVKAAKVYPSLGEVLGCSMQASHILLLFLAWAATPVLIGVLVFLASYPARWVCRGFRS